MKSEEEEKNCRRLEVMKEKKTDVDDFYDERKSLSIDWYKLMNDDNINECLHINDESSEKSIH